MIRACLALLMGLSAFAPALAAEPPAWRHALSMMGEPKYAENFQHFDYVNPNAPKGGVLRLGQQGTFDSFNVFIAGVKGELEAGIGRVYDQLMAQSSDEVGTEYGLLAEAVRHPPDHSSVTYRLRPEARWHDGVPVSAADVIFTFETLKANDPQSAFYYKNVVKAEETAEREITFTFSETGNRELPQIVGQMRVMPKHWWQGAGPDGRARDVTQTTLEPPLGSGPYRLKSFEAGRTAAYERVADYWARDLNVNRGQHNFGEIRHEYYRDGTVLLEAFKGDRIDYRSENSARNWAVGYDFPARREGRVILEEFPLRATGVMQAFAPNLRREKFKDQRVRRALNLAYDFEEMNRTLFYGAYKRISSYFYGTELASGGLPQGQELAVLESLRGKVPEAVFTTPYANPVGGGPEAVRANLRDADRLLREAGWELRGNRRVHAKTGETLALELLGNDPNDERVFLVYKPALERLGIGVTVRIVDQAQYVNRVRAFDFDVIIDLWPQSLSPGNEQREFWGSDAADRPGSRNTLGIKDEAIDALIEKIVFAQDRAALVATTKALDRVLLHHHFVVPQFWSDTVRAARWDRFGRPEKLPEYGASGFPAIWWYDEARAAKAGGMR